MGQAQLRTNKLHELIYRKVIKSSSFLGCLVLLLGRPLLPSSSSSSSALPLVSNIIGSGVLAASASASCSTGYEVVVSKFSNVGELKKSGIRLRKAKRGVTNIQFSNYFLLTYLHVPPLTIDGLTKDLLASLVDFEQLVSESDRGVTAYIRFINELAPTYRDSVILRDKGIIHVKDEKLKSTIVVRMLDNLITPNKSNFTPNWRLIRRKIEHHKRPPWGIIGGIISFFTIVQTVLAIVAYVKPPT